MCISANINHTCRFCVRLIPQHAHSFSSFYFFFPFLLSAVDQAMFFYYYNPNSLVGDYCSGVHFLSSTCQQRREPFGKTSYSYAAYNFYMNLLLFHPLLFVRAVCDWSSSAFPHRVCISTGSLPPCLSRFLVIHFLQHIHFRRMIAPSPYPLLDGWNNPSCNFFPFLLLFFTVFLLFHCPPPSFFFVPLASPYSF